MNENYIAYAKEVTPDVKWIVHGQTGLELMVTGYDRRPDTETHIMTTEKWHTNVELFKYYKTVDGFPIGEKIGGDDAL